MLSRSPSHKHQNYSEVHTLQIARLLQQKPTKQYTVILQSQHNDRCNVPKPPKQIKTKKQLIEHDQKIKLFRTPILNDLRIVVQRFMDSSNRLLQYLNKDQNCSAVRLYKQDRKQLIHYLNTIIVRKVNINKLNPSISNDRCNSHSKTKLERQNQKEQQLEKILSNKQLQQKVSKREKKRSLTADGIEKLQYHHLEKKIKNPRVQSKGKNQFQAYQKKKQQFKLHTQLADLEAWKQQLVNSLKQEKRRKIHPNPQIKQNDALQLEIRRCGKKQLKCKQNIQELKGHLSYIELMIFISTQMLSQFIKYARTSQDAIYLRKQQFNLLAQSLNNILKHIHSINLDTNNNILQHILHQMREYIKSLILQINSLHHKTLIQCQMKAKVIKQLQILRESDRKNDGVDLHEVHEKVNRSLREIQDLQDECQKKDQIIDYYKSQNFTLNEQLKSMDEMIISQKQKIKMITRELEEAYQKLKDHQQQVIARQDYISALIEQSHSQEKNILQSINQSNNNQEQLKGVISNLKRIEKQYNDIQLQMKEMQQLNQDLKRHLDDLRHRLQFSEQQNIVLSKKIEIMLTEMEGEKVKLRELEDRNEYLQKQNEKLYIEISNMQYLKFFSQQDKLPAIKTQTNANIQVKKGQQIMNISQNNLPGRQVISDDKQIQRPRIQTIKQQNLSQFIKIEETEYHDVGINKNGQNPSIAEPHRLISQQLHDHTSNNGLIPFNQYPKQQAYTNYDIIVKNENFDAVAVLQTLGLRFQSIIQQAQQSQHHLKIDAIDNSGESVFQFSNIADKTDSLLNHEEIQQLQNNNNERLQIPQNLQDDLQAQTLSSVSKIVNYGQKKQSKVNNSSDFQQFPSNKGRQKRQRKQSNYDIYSNYNGSKPIDRIQSVQDDWIVDKNKLQAHPINLKHVNGQFQRKAELRMSGYDQQPNNRDSILPSINKKKKKANEKKKRDIYINFRGGAMSEVGGNDKTPYHKSASLYNKQ